MKVGLAIFRCGEPQCTPLLYDVEQMKQFHCVHIADNISPFHVAVNTTVKKCFDDGCEWVVMLDGDMELLPDRFWPAFHDAIKRPDCKGKIFFKLWDPYIQKNIGHMKVTNKAWMDAAGWYTDNVVCDRIAEGIARTKDMKRLNVDIVTGVHFENPTQFQIFRRFFVRGIKVAQGYNDMVGDYTKIISGLALEAYNFGLKTVYKGDPLCLDYLLKKYDEFLGDCVVCGTCVWGTYPYGYWSKNEKAIIEDPRMQANYINRLAIGIGQHMKVKHRMIYLSPSPVEGVIPECKWVKLESILPHKNLNKLGMYHDDVLSLGERFIFFDLDNVPIGDLSGMVAALDKSNGFLCRSEKYNIGQNIPGGDMIGFTKRCGLFIRQWVIDNIIKSNSSIANKIKTDGAERFLYRYLVECHPSLCQFWRDFLGDEAIIGWKGHIKRLGYTLNDKNILITAWGDTMMHTIKEGWVQQWASLYGYPSKKHATVTANNDLVVWKLCRSCMTRREIFNAAAEQGVKVWFDSDGHLLYRRFAGGIVELDANKCMAHPNGLRCIND